MNRRDAFFSFYSLFGALIAHGTEPTAIDYDQLGNACTARQDWKGAIDQFSLALKLDPKDVAACAGRGVAEQRRGQIAEAIADLNLAIQLDPKNSWNYLNRGKARMDLHDADGAIADYSQALVFDPHNSEAFYFRGLTEMFKYKMAAAQADFNQGLALDPTQTNMVKARADTLAPPPSFVPPMTFDPLSDVEEVDHVKQKIDPSEIELDRMAKVTITIEDAREDVFATHASTFNIELPNVDGLISSDDGSVNNTSLTNGKASSSFTKGFLIQALRPGDYTIPAFDVTDQSNHTYHIREMKLKVHGNTANPASTPTGSITKPPSTSVLSKPGSSGAPDSD